MKISIALCILLVGCSKEQVKPPAIANTSAQPAQPVVVIDPTEAQEIASLRAAAKAKHLHFSIRCNSDDTGFDAEAWPDTMDYNPAYVEDGGVPAWIVFGASTQEVAARKLLHLLDKPTNWIPGHKPQNKKNHCPPEVRG